VNNEVREALSELLSTIPSQHGKLWSESDARAVFERVVNDGWARVGLSEKLGGAGGDVVDAASVAYACASSAHLLPLPDMILVAGRLLEMAKLPLPEEVTCALPLLEVASIDGDGVNARAQRVPYGRWASHFLVLTAGRHATKVHLIDAADAVVGRGRNLAEEPRDEVVLSHASAIASADMPRPAREVLAQLRLAGALARSIQMSAASTAVLKLSATYCSDRRQFGKRLAEFQAVQQEIAGLQGEAAASNAAVDHAVNALASLAVRPALDWPTAPVATAKVRTGLAAGRAARSAHQLHGAIGTTLEYPLARHTRALWSWRDEFGGEAEWASRLIGEIMPDAATDPWQRLTSV
jgi:acyl-CoA dehydrogenase